jgi:predicted house-cleaning noncanonical NTP pyrophosphatase (MazG superfamily)
MTGKLVRDKMPEIIAANGEVIEHKVLGLSDYVDALRAKLVEEAHEVLTASSENVLEELADVYEVILTITIRLGYTVDELRKKVNEKYKERGGFTKGIWMDL